MSAVSSHPSTRPRPDHHRSLTGELEQIVDTWANSQYELVTVAAEFADSPEWVLTGSRTAAHWLAIITDVEPCTAREWLSRSGRVNRPAFTTATSNI